MCHRASPSRCDGGTIGGFPGLSPRPPPSGGDHIRSPWPWGHWLSRQHTILSYCDPPASDRTARLAEVAAQMADAAGRAAALRGHSPSGKTLASRSSRSGGRRARTRVPVILRFPLCRTGGSTGRRAGPPRPETGAPPHPDDPRDPHHVLAMASTRASVAQGGSGGDDGREAWLSMGMCRLGPSIRP